MMKRGMIFAAALWMAAPLALAQGAPGGPGPAMPMGHRGMESMGHGMHGGGDRLLPPGTWWRDQQTASAIGLSAEQQKKIDGIFLDARVQLIHMHATLEEAELRLDDTLHAPSLDAARAQKEIDQAADTRASLEKVEAHMLLSIRGVLTADQWTKLQALHARRFDHGPDMRRGPDARRGAMGMHGRRGPDGPPDNGMPHAPAAGQRPDGPPPAAAPMQQ